MVQILHTSHETDSVDRMQWRGGTYKTRTPTQVPHDADTNTSTLLILKI